MLSTSSWKFWGFQDVYNQTKLTTNGKKKNNLGELLLKEKDHSVLFFLARVEKLFVYRRVERNSFAQWKGASEKKKKKTYQLIQAVWPFDPDRWRSPTTI